MKKKHRNYKKAHNKIEHVYMHVNTKKPSFQKAKRKLLKVPIRQIDLTKTKTLNDIIESFKGMSIQARRIGQCADVYENMLSCKKRQTVFLGLAGPLIAGGLRKVIRDMIEYGLVDVVVSTGAILYQDLFMAQNYKLYKGSPYADDSYLRRHLINRIYDTYVDDEQFIKLDSWVGSFAETLEQRSYSSREFLNCLGNALTDKNSILRTAAQRGVPIFAPALNDSSIGIGLTEYYHNMKKNKQSKCFIIDAIRDNYELTQIVIQSQSTSAVYVAGGVPKNFINDSVVMGYIFGKITGGHAYAFQVTTDVPHWGGLSGSTLDEATSWGKINVKAHRAMAFVEPTVSLPLIVGSILHKDIWKKRKRLEYVWNGDILKSLKAGKKISRKL
ncbi:MAG: deoxyhypusine synthase family protein [Candidatus Omnitrophica bacterium]|nr:deoxyhypusine synthase family protein [Candidatus Omnitrophota bacterium]